MHVAAVVVLLLVWNVVNVVGVAVMAGCCGLSVRQFRHEGAVGVLQAGMRRRSFWPAFWISGVAVVANTATPLLLLAWFPLLPVVAGFFAVNLATNLPAVPFRWGLWMVRPGSIDWSIG